MKERDPRYIPERRDTAKHLYLREGKTIREIADIMGVSKTTVEGYLNDARVRRRRPGPRRKKKRGSTV